MIMKQSILILSLAFSGWSAHADLDDASKEALAKTQTLLQSKSQRSETLKTSPDAAAADAKVKAVAPSAKDQESIYAISSQVFGTMVDRTNGNVDKQKEMMIQAQKDPKAFFDNLPEDQKAAIRDLAGKIGADK
jgi:hypothetical protein